MNPPQTPELASLLAEADAADPGKRINYRDPIAACGAAAISAMTSWLKNDKHTGFAIRTLERIGEAEDPLLAEFAVRSLRKVRARLSKSDQQLTKNALRRLGEPDRAAIAEPDFRLYDRLIDAARGGQLLTYSEVGEPAGLQMKLSRGRRIIGQMLGQLSRREVGAERPMLSSIVVHKGSSTVGPGFYPLGLELDLVRDGEDDKAFGQRQQAETFEFWAAHPEAGPLD